MRIGFFTDTFVPQTNGVVTALCDFGAELTRRRHQVNVFCPRTTSQNIKGMRVFSYPSVTFRPYPEYRLGLPFITRRAPDLDVVHCHGPFTFGVYGLRVAQKQDVPAVGTFHTLLPEYVHYVSRLRFPKKYLQKIAWTYCKHHYNQYDIVTTPSAYIKNQLQAHGVRKPVLVVPNGVNPRFKPMPKAKARKKLGLDNGRVFLYLGRLGFEKNVADVIRAVKGLNCTLVIAGKGPADSELRGLAKKLSLDNVRFDGFVPNELLPAYYSAADAFVTASKSETQGIVVLESMACSTPVIAANALALPEIIAPGKNGFLFNTKDQLKKMLARFEPSTTLRKNAEKTAQQYSLKKCTDKLEKAYEIAGAQ